MLLRLVECCSGLQRVAEISGEAYAIVLLYIAVGCNLLQFVAVCCNWMQRAAAMSGEVHGIVLR